MFVTIEDSGVSMARQHVSAKKSKSWVSTSVAAEALEVDQSTIIRWCQSGKIPAHRVGFYWRISKATLARILESVPNGEQELTNQI